MDPPLPPPTSFTHTHTHIHKHTCPHTNTTSTTWLRGQVFLVVMAAFLGSFRPLWFLCRQSPNVGLFCISHRLQRTPCRCVFSFSWGIWSTSVFVVCCRWQSAGRWRTDTLLVSIQTLVHMGIDRSWRKNTTANRTLHGHINFVHNAEFRANVERLANWATYGCSKCAHSKKGRSVCCRLCLHFRVCVCVCVCVCALNKNDRIDKNKKHSWQKKKNQKQNKT